MLRQHKLVLKIHERQESQRHIYFQYGPDLDPAREGVYITRKVWDELGQPGAITIKLEAGDNLEGGVQMENILDRIPSRLPNANIHVGPSED